MSKFRIFSIFLAVGLLIGAFGLGSVLAGGVDWTGLDTPDTSYGPASIADITGLDTLSASHAPAAVVLTDGQVEFTDVNGDAVSFVKLETTGYLFVMDDDLETTKEGQVAAWTGATQRTDGTMDPFSITDGTVAGDPSAEGDYLLTDDDDSYDTTVPSNTPISSLSVVIDSFTSFAQINAAAGTFTVVGGTAPGAEVTATFGHHVVDKWLGTDATQRRAHVFSTSDPAGEYVTLDEVVAVGLAPKSSPISQIFRGTIILGQDAVAQGTANDGIWVQDGDTVTVNYLDSKGNIVDSDTMTADGIVPAITSLTPADGAVTNVNNPTLQFDVTDLGSGVPTINPADAITITIANSANRVNASFQAIANGFRVIFASGTSWRDTTAAGFSVPEGHGNSFLLTITADDKAENRKTLRINLTIDQTLPTANSAQTGVGWDVDSASRKTGVRNGIELVMSEPIDASTVEASDFTIDGVQANTAFVGSVASERNKIYLTTTTDLDPDAKPLVAVTGTISDLATNDLNTTLAAATQTATDGIDPTPTTSLDAALLVTDQAIGLTVVTDEKLAVNGLKASIQGPANSSANGILNTTSPSPLNNTGSRTITFTAGTGMYGVAIQVTDLGNNITNNLKAVTGEAGTISTSTNTSKIKVANGPIADVDFSGGGFLTRDDIATLTVGGVDMISGENITGVNASEREITINLGTADGLANTDAVVVSYSYVNSATFEVDQTAPTVTFDPADDTDVAKTAPFIRVIFDDDEYPGDSFTSVTLTAASLTMPDGSTMDVLANFVVEADGVNYIWAAQDLALGAYTLTVSGEDVAGNDVTDAAATFDIIERSAYSIALRPGWNLISLPGVPDSMAIADVVTNDKIDTVLTFDPNTPGKWLTAVRDGDGFVGNLTTVGARLGYWVHTTTFDPLAVDIPALTAGRPILPPAHVISEGWNLVAVSVLDQTTTVIDADRYFGSINWIRAITFDTEADAFMSITPDGILTDDTEVSVGKGYFVYAGADGTLVP